VILLSEGHMIYNGPPKFVAEYFTQFGLTIGRFTNPADTLAQVAACPSMCLQNDTNILDLASQCQL